MSRARKRTDSSQCLVGGAEGIRTAGPLCAPIFREGLCRWRFQRITKPHGEIFSDATYRNGRAENRGISTGLRKAKEPKEDRRFESPLTQQRGTANRRFDPSILKAHRRFESPLLQQRGTANQVNALGDKANGAAFLVRSGRAPPRPRTEWALRVRGLVRPNIEMGKGSYTPPVRQPDQVTRTREYLTPDEVDA
jgi:hypothetical protein